MIELFEKYPKAANIVKSYYLEKLLESLKSEGLPEEFKEHVRQQGIDDEKVVKLVETMPRSLFDVFDENEIYIEILTDAVFMKPKFQYKISLLDKQKFDTRKEAEKEAINVAFKLLEEKL